MNPAVTTELIVTDDIEMKYSVFGTGKKNFIMIPGLSIKEVTLSAPAVAAAYAEFAEEYKVWLFDRRLNAPADYSIEAMAEDTVKVIKVLGIGSADFFGASQGGMICQYIAASHPELVHALVLASTLCRPNDCSRRVIDGWIAAAKAHDGHSLVADSVDKIYSAATLDAYRDAIIASMSELNDEEFDRFVTMAGAIRGFDASELLDRIGCPVLVIGSKGDLVVTGDASRELAGLLHCQLYLYDSSFGHAVYDEAPDFKKRLLDFYHTA